MRNGNTTEVMSGTLSHTTAAAARCSSQVSSDPADASDHVAGR
jgi:hypothetical protein